MIKRTLILAYGILSYAVFFCTSLYAIGFIGNFRAIGNLSIPKTIDGAIQLPLWQALSVDASLLAVFALQHSVMARPAFKRWWTRFIAVSAERSTYVLASSAALIALFMYWQPLGGMIWRAENTIAQTSLQALYAAGWLLVFTSTYLINHFDLFGLRQVWLQFIGKPYTPLKFATPGPYRIVRHPLYVGWLLVFWSTPTMSATHLFFAVMTTLYILIAIRFEERDLVAAHPEYENYRREVPMLLPRITSAPSTQTSLR